PSRRRTWGVQAPHPPGSCKRRAFDMAQRRNIGSGNWNDPNTWTPGGVPTASDDVLVNFQTGNPVVTVSLVAAAQRVLSGVGNTLALARVSLQSPTVKVSGTLLAQAGSDKAMAVTNSGGIVKVAPGVSLAVASYASETVADKVLVEDATLTIADPGIAGA